MTKKKYRLRHDRGSHSLKTRTDTGHLGDPIVVRPGEVIETEADLVAAFPDKFELLDEPEPDAESEAPKPKKAKKRAKR